MQLLARPLLARRLAAEPSSLRRPVRVVVLLLAVLVLALPASAGAQTPPPPAAPDVAGLCLDPALRCPDLTMRRPEDFSVRRTASGRSLLRSTNAILSVGAGPLAVIARRAGAPRGTMWVRQRIDRADGPPLVVRRPGARVVWKAIPGQGHYWKFRDAARFELWTMGEERQLVRTGPKQVYCLRDLQRTRATTRGPRSRVFPACSQDPREERRVLGTSVGWADVYPAGYHENWIDVTGLRGCFALWHIADPLNHLVESDETNNAQCTVLRLPFRGGAGTCRGMGEGDGGTPPDDVDPY